MPKDEAQFTIVAEGTALTVTPLEAGSDATLVFTSKAADLDAIGKGEVDLNVAFMQGRVKAAGDMKQLFALLRGVYS